MEGELSKVWEAWLQLIPIEINQDWCKIKVIESEARYIGSSKGVVWLLRGGCCWLGKCVVIGVKYCFVVEISFSVDYSLFAKVRRKSTIFSVRVGLFFMLTARAYLMRVWAKVFACRVGLCFCLVGLGAVWGFCCWINESALYSVLLLPELLQDVLCVLATELPPSDVYSWG